jgi:hypothetical protein
MPWFAADYAAIQANGNVGTSIIGSVALHAHAQLGGSAVNGNSTLNPGYPVSGALVASTAQLVNTGTTGGTANLPAGARVLKCVKY